MAYPALKESVMLETLELYKTLLALRRESSLGSGTFEWLQGFDDDVIAFRNGLIGVIANLGSNEVDLPEGQILVVSGEHGAGSLPPNTTAWVKLSS